MVAQSTSPRDILLLFPPLNPLILHPEVGPLQLLGWLRSQGADAGALDLNAAFLRDWMPRGDALDELLHALTPGVRALLHEELLVLRRRADTLGDRFPDGPGIVAGRPAARKVLDHLYRVVALPLVGNGDSEDRDPGAETLGSILRAAAKERDLARLAEHRLARTIHDSLLAPEAWTPEALRQSLALPVEAFDRFLDHALAPRLHDDLRVAGISVHGTPHLAPALRIAAWLRTRRPEVRVVLGGPWCGAAAEVLAEDPDFFDWVDGVCTGPGEGPLADLVEARRPLDHVPGFLIRTHGRVHSTGPAREIPLGELPAPDYSEVDWSLHPERVAAFPTVRGCTWSRCLFCYHVLDDKACTSGADALAPARAAALAGFVQRCAASGEVESLFLADNATPPVILDQVAEVLAGEPAALPWEAMARFDPAITAQRAQAWSRGGCVGLSFGLETSDPQELRKLRKGIRTADAAACLAACSAEGITTLVFALDYPSQPPGGYEATLQWLLDRGADLGDMIPLRFALGRGSGAYRDPAALGLDLGAEHRRWYDVYDLPFAAPGWPGPERFREVTEEAMVELELRRSGAGPDKDLLLFLPNAVADFKDKGFFAYPACYHLEAALGADPEVVAAWDLEVLPFRTPTAGPMAHGDRRWERILYDVRTRAPRVVAFSLYGWSVEPSLRLARALRIVAPEILLVAGGPEVADREELAPGWGVFDALIEGDGEAALAGWLGSLSRGEEPEGLSGLSWRTGDRWRHNPLRGQGRDLPIPDYYSPNPQHLAGEAYYLSTRGCDRACAYCQWATQGLRQKPREQIDRELRAILGSSSVGAIVFFDYDLLEIYRDDPETFAMIRAALKTRPEVAVQFFTSPGNLGRAALSELVEGLRISRIMVGIQSMSPEALAAVNRGWAVSQLQDLEVPPRSLRRHVVIELIYPLPEETPESFFCGLDRLVRMGYSRFQIFPLVVLPGTGLYRHAARWGLRFMEEPPRYALETAAFPAAAMREAQGVAWILSLLNEFNGTEARDVDALDAWVGATPGLIGQLRARVRDGEELDRILEDLMAAIHGADFVGAGRVTDFLAVAGRDDLLARIPGEEGPDSSELPDPMRIVQVLSDAGVEVLEHGLREGALSLRIRSRDGEVDLQIFPADDSRLYYKAAGRYKVAYSGPLPDMGIMDQLVNFLEEER